MEVEVILQMFSWFFDTLSTLFSMKAKKQRREENKTIKAEKEQKTFKKKPHKKSLKRTLNDPKKLEDAKKHKKSKKTKAVANIMNVFARVVQVIETIIIAVATFIASNLLLCVIAVLLIVVIVGASLTLNNGSGMCICQIVSQASGTTSESSGTFDGTIPNTAECIAKEKARIDNDIARGLLTQAKINQQGVAKVYMGWQMITDTTSDCYGFMAAIANNDRSAESANAVSTEIRKKKSRQEVYSALQFDSDGYGMVDGRYTVAVKRGYGELTGEGTYMIGDYVDIYLENGTVIKAVLADSKREGNESSSETSNRVMHNDGSIVEFVVDHNTWYSGGKGNHKNPSEHRAEWKSKVIAMKRVGSFFSAAPQAQQGNVGDSVSKILDPNNLPSGYVLFEGLIRLINKACPIHGSGTNSDGANGDTVGLAPREYEKAQQGVVQGKWDTATASSLAEHKWKQYFGACYSMNNKDEVMGGSTTYEQWRNSNKWKVPYYRQKNVEIGSSCSDGGINVSNNCHVFMASCMASALQGRLINVAEMWAGLKITGGVDGNSYCTNAGMYKTMNKLKIAWVGMKNDGTIVNSGTEHSEFFSAYKGGTKDKVDACLADGGVVGISVKQPSKFCHSGHYFTILEKTGDKYIVMSAGYPHIDYQAVTWEELEGADKSLLRVMADGSCYFLAKYYGDDVVKTTGGGTEAGKINASTSQVAQLSMNDRYTLICGSAGKSGMLAATRLSASTCGKMQASFEVGGWQLQSDGSKVMKTWTINCHKELGAELQQILKEIADHPSKPVVQHSSGDGSYCYRPLNSGNLSGHCLGAAIDLAVPWNPMPGVCGSAKDYNPDTDERSFGANGVVVQTFKAHGWYWGGDYNTPDYMHFEYVWVHKGKIPNQ